MHVSASARRTGPAVSTSARAYVSDDRCKQEVTRPRGACRVPRGVKVPGRLEVHSSSSTRRPRVSHVTCALSQERRGIRQHADALATSRTVGQMPSCAAASRSLLPNWACVAGTIPTQACRISVARVHARAAGPMRLAKWGRTFRAAPSGVSPARDRLYEANTARCKPAGLPGSGAARCHTSFWCAWPALAAPCVRLQ